MLSPMPANRTRVPALALVAVLAGAAVTGCGSAPERIDPSGVDGLVIPAPEIDARDFDAPQAHDWFPLEPGSVPMFRRSEERRVGQEGGSTCRSRRGSYP